MVGFHKHGTTSTNLVTEVNTLLHSVSSPGKNYSVYFDLIYAFDTVPHYMLLCKLVSFGHSLDYVNLFLTCLTNRHAPVRILRTPSAYAVKSDLHKDPHWDPCSSIFLLM